VDAPDLAGIEYFLEGVFHLDEYKLVLGHHVYGFLLNQYLLVLLQESLLSFVLSMKFFLELNIS
jgi:hypothetical protein